MQSTNELLVEYLSKSGFKNVKDTGDQIKFNLKELSKYEIQLLLDAPVALKLLIKRSGNGVAVIFS